MYKDSRPTGAHAATASTPELWAEIFAKSTRMNAWRMFRFGLTKEWTLIRRHVRSGGAVLDAGCGFGEWVSFLNRKGYRAEGLDFSQELVARLRETYPQLVWTQGDVKRLPYSTGAFDAVVSWGVIEHEEAGPGEALAEFKRVLKPGGVAILTVPMDSAANRRAADYLYRRTSQPQSFFQYFMTSQEFTGHLHDAGFEIIDSGILPNAVLQLVSPPLAARLRGVPFRLANLLVSTFLSRVPRFCVMRYCVGLKVSAHDTSKAS